MFSFLAKTATCIQSLLVISVNFANFVTDVDQEQQKLSEFIGIKKNCFVFANIYFFFEKWRKGYFLLTLAFVASTKVESVMTAKSTIKIETIGYSGAFCVGVDVKLGDEDALAVEDAVGVVDDFGEVELTGVEEGFDVNVGEGVAVFGPKTMFALMFVQGICSKSVCPPVASFIGVSRVVWLKATCEVPKERTWNVKVTRTPLPLSVE